MGSRSPSWADAPLPSAPSATAAASSRRRLARCCSCCCTASQAAHCVSHCGYPQHSLCCFGCSHTTRAVFIGSGGVMAGLCYMFLLLVLLVCYGTDVLRENYIATGLLVEGVVYLPMGMALIYSAQKRNPFLLSPWIAVNFFFVVVEVVCIIVAPIHAAKAPPPFCKKENFALAMLLLQICIVACRCYCIAVVTQYRRKLLAAKAERRAEAGRPFTTY